MIVTYGGHSGGNCADQLRQVLDGLKMEMVATMPGLGLSREFIEANADAIDPALELAGQLEILQQACQTALNWAPTSARNRDPLWVGLCR